MTKATATELVDSGHLLPSGEALRARITADDYLFFRELLDPALVRRVGWLGLSHLQRAGWTEPGSDPWVAVWDSGLGESVRASGVEIEEELVVDLLLSDLASE